MKFKLRLCEKRIKDVVIEAKTHKEAIGKTAAMLKKGLRGMGVKQVEWVETKYKD